MWWVCDGGTSVRMTSFDRFDDSIRGRSVLIDLPDQPVPQIARQRIPRPKNRPDEGDPDAQHRLRQTIALVEPGFGTANHHDPRPGDGEPRYHQDDAEDEQPAL